MERLQFGALAGSRSVSVRLVPPVRVQSDPGSAASAVRRFGGHTEASGAIWRVFRVGLVAAYDVRGRDVRGAVHAAAAQHIVAVRAVLGADQSNRECVADAEVVPCHIPRLSDQPASDISVVVLMECDIRVC